MVTREQLLSEGWVSVGVFGGYEYLARRDGRSILLHVARNGQLLREFPESFTLDKIDALAAAKAALEVR